MPSFRLISRTRKGYSIATIQTFTFQIPPRYLVILKGNQGFEYVATAGADVGWTKIP